MLKTVAFILLTLFPCTAAAVADNESMSEGEKEQLKRLQKVNEEILQGIRKAEERQKKQQARQQLKKPEPVEPATNVANTYNPVISNPCYVMGPNGYNIQVDAGPHCYQELPCYVMGPNGYKIQVRALPYCIENY